MGRPRKQRTMEAPITANMQTPAPEPPEETVPVYSHESKMRCTAPSKAYPSFMGKECGAIMSATGTLNGGMIKRWKCPRCGATCQTAGKEI